MTDDVRRPTPLLAPVATALCAALHGSASLAGMSDGCVRVADRAALQAVARTLPIGQTTVFGSPFAIAPGVLRVEVDVFGPDSLIYAADVRLDGACKVLSTSVRLENNPWRRW